MSTQYACPSPRGTNNAGLFLTRAGRLVDRRGNDWGASSIRRMANDSALGAPPGTGTSTRKWGPGDWAKNHTRHALGDALEAACEEHGLSDDQHQELRDLVEQRLHGGAQEADMGATDRNKGKGARDDDDGLAEFRKQLASKGLNADEIEEACGLARRDAEAKDRLPVNALEGGRGGYTSGVSKDAEEDFEREFPDSANTTRDPYGAPHSENFDPNVGKPGYNPRVYAAGLRAAEALSGSGVSRRLSNDAAMSDADLAMEYPGIENVGTSMFGSRG
jgi:hypothetical protein